MAEIILNGLTADDLLRQIEGVIKIQVEQALKNTKLEELQERYLSIDETRKMFTPAISRPTIYKWASQGIIKKHVIGGKAYFKYSDILRAIKEVSPYRSKPNCGK